MKNSVYLVHNTKCSKSNGALKILTERNISFQIINYLDGELSETFLKEIVSKLGLRPKEMVRTKDELFQTLNLNLENDSKVIQAILSHPQILERPIVVFKDHAIIARPPELILEHI